jgi:hypothetical protein
MAKITDIPRAFVYWNLHKHVYSCKNTRTGRVEAHARVVHVTDADLVVRPAGRARVLREKCKNVHAGVRGQCWAWTSSTFAREEFLRGGVRLTYNPYKYDSFVRASDERPVVGADEVLMVIRDGKAQMFARGLRFRDEESKAA